MRPRSNRSAALLAALILGVGLLAAMSPTAIAKPRPDVPRDAAIPASCTHQATVLDGYQKDFGVQGFAQLQVGKAATGRLGKSRKRLTVVPLLCTAGGVSWPNYLLVYDRAGALVGSVDLGRSRAPQEHVDVKSIHIKRHRAHVALAGYDGCCFTSSVRKGVLTWRKGAVAWQATGALTVDYARGRDSYEIGPGIVTSASDAKIWLPPAPAGFQKFIRHRWKRLENAYECDYPTTISVDRYTHKGFALGGETACGGAAYVWARVKGKWKPVLGYQDGPYCDGLHKIQRRALRALGEACYDLDGTRHQLGHWPRSGI